MSSYSSDDESSDLSLEAPDIDLDFGVTTAKPVARNNVSSAYNAPRSHGPKHAISESIDCPLPKFVDNRPPTRWIGEVDDVDAEEAEWELRQEIGVKEEVIQTCFDPLRFRNDNDPLFKDSNPKIRRKMNVHDPLFDPVLFLSKAHTETTFKDLQVGLSRLDKTRSGRAVKMMELVRQHFGQFVHCKDTIDIIQKLLEPEVEYASILASRASSSSSSTSRVVTTTSTSTSTSTTATTTAAATERANANEQRVTSQCHTARVNVILSTVQEKACELYKPLLVYRDEVQSIRHSLHLTRRLKVLFEMPGRLRAHILSNQPSQVVLDYRRLKSISLPPNASSLLFEVMEDAKATCRAYADRLAVTLGDPRIPLDAHQRTMALLVDLDYSRYPAWDFLDRQCLLLCATVDCAWAARSAAISRASAMYAAGTVGWVDALESADAAALHAFLDLLSSRMPTFLTLCHGVATGAVNALSQSGTTVSSQVDSVAVGRILQLIERVTLRIVAYTRAMIFPAGTKESVVGKYGQDYGQSTVTTQGQGQGNGYGYGYGYGSASASGFGNGNGTKGDQGLTEGMSGSEYEFPTDNSDVSDLEDSERSCDDISGHDTRFGISHAISMWDSRFAASGFSFPSRFLDSLDLADGYRLSSQLEAHLPSFGFMSMVPAHAILTSVLPDQTFHTPMFVSDRQGHLANIASLTASMGGSVTGGSVNIGTGTGTGMSVGVNSPMAGGSGSDGTGSGNGSGGGNGKEDELVTSMSFFADDDGKNDSRKNQKSENQDSGSSTTLTLPIYSGKTSSSPNSTPFFPNTPTTPATTGPTPLLLSSPFGENPPDNQNSQVSEPLLPLSTLLSPTGAIRSAPKSVRGVWPVDTPLTTICTKCRLSLPSNSKYAQTLDNFPFPSPSSSRHCVCILGCIRIHPALPSLITRLRNIVDMLSYTAMVRDKPIVLRSLTELLLDATEYLPAQLIRNTYTCIHALPETWVKPEKILPPTPPTLLPLHFNSLLNQCLSTLSCLPPRDVVQMWRKGRKTPPFDLIAFFTEVTLAFADRLHQLAFSPHHRSSTAATAHALARLSTPPSLLSLHALADSLALQLQPHSLADPDVFARAIRSGVPSVADMHKANRVCVSGLPIALTSTPTASTFSATGSDGSNAPAAGVGVGANVTTTTTTTTTTTINTSLSTHTSTSTSTSTTTSTSVAMPLWLLDCPGKGSPLELITILGNITFTIHSVLPRIWSQLATLCSQQLPLPKHYMCGKCNAPKYTNNNNTRNRGVVCSCDCTTLDLALDNAYMHILNTYGTLERVVATKIVSLFEEQFCAIFQNMCKNDLTLDDTILEIRPPLIDTLKSVVFIHAQLMSFEYPQAHTIITSTVMALAAQWCLSIQSLPRLSHNVLRRLRLETLLLADTIAPLLPSRACIDSALSHLDALLDDVKEVHKVAVSMGLIAGETGKRRRERKRDGEKGRERGSISADGLGNGNISTGTGLSEGQGAGATMISPTIPTSNNTITSPDHNNNNNPGMGAGTGTGTGTGMGMGGNVPIALTTGLWITEEQVQKELKKTIEATRLTFAALRGYTAEPGARGGGGVGVGVGMGMGGHGYDSSQPSSPVSTSTTFSTASSTRARRHDVEITLTNASTAIARRYLSQDPRVSVENEGVRLLMGGGNKRYASWQQESSVRRAARNERMARVRKTIAAANNKENSEFGREKKDNKSGGRKGKWSDSDSSDLELPDFGKPKFSEKLGSYGKNADSGESAIVPKRRKSVLGSQEGGSDSDIDGVQPKLRELERRLRKNPDSGKNAGVSESGKSSADSGKKKNRFLDGLDDISSLSETDEEKTSFGKSAKSGGKSSRFDTDGEDSDIPAFGVKKRGDVGKSDSTRRGMVGKKEEGKKENPESGKDTGKSKSSRFDTDDEDDIPTFGKKTRAGAGAGADVSGKAGEKDGKKGGEGKKEKEDDMSDGAMFGKSKSRKNTGKSGIATPDVSASEDDALVGFGKRSQVSKGRINGGNADEGGSRRKAVEETEDEDFGFGKASRKSTASSTSASASASASASVASGMSSRADRTALDDDGGRSSTRNRTKTATDSTRSNTNTNANTNTVTTSTAATGTGAGAADGGKKKIRAKKLKDGRIIDLDTGLEIDVSSKKVKITKK